MKIKAAFNMEHNAIIKIQGHQQVDGEDSPVNELTTQGRYQFTDSRTELIYDESELTGLEGTETTFVATANEVILSRKGTVTSQMIFRKGQKHTFLYETPHGTMTMRLDTRHIKNKLDKNGGRLELEYDIDFETAQISRNKFIIDVKTQKTS